VDDGDIPLKQFLNIVYNILFHPTQEFRVVAIGPVPKDLLLVYSILFVLFISGMGIIYSPMVISTDGLAFKILISALTGLLFWLFSGAVFSITAFVFGRRGRPLTLLILTGYATLPWLFLPVMMQFKAFGAIGNTIAIFGSLGLWLWSTILYLMAIKYTYELSLERILLAASLPILMAFLGLSWVGGFFFNLAQFFS
jgi:hypothetical protein